VRVRGREGEIESEYSGEGEASTLDKKAYVSLFFEIITLWNPKTNTLYKVIALPASASGKTPPPPPPPPRFSLCFIFVWLSVNVIRSLWLSCTFNPTEVLSSLMALHAWFAIPTSVYTSGIL